MHEADVGDDTPRVRGHALELPGELPAGPAGRVDGLAGGRPRERLGGGARRQDATDGQRHGADAAAQEVGEVERSRGPGPGQGGGAVRGEQLPSHL